MIVFLTALIRELAVSLLTKLTEKQVKHMNQDQTVNLVTKLVVVGSAALGAKCGFNPQDWESLVGLVVSAIAGIGAFIYSHKYNATPTVTTNTNPTTTTTK
jgi:hypothetical protein